MKLQMLLKHTFVNTSTSQSCAHLWVTLRNMSGLHSDSWAAVTGFYFFSWGGGGWHHTLLKLRDTFFCRDHNEMLMESTSLKESNIGSCQRGWLMNYQYRCSCVEARQEQMDLVTSCLPTASFNVCSVSYCKFVWKVSPTDTRSPVVSATSTHILTHKY